MTLLQVVYDNMCGIATIPVEGAHEYRGCTFIGSDLSADSIGIAKRNVCALADRDAASRIVVFPADGTRTPLGETKERRARVRESERVRVCVCVCVCAPAQCVVTHGHP